MSLRDLESLKTVDEVDEGLLFVMMERIYHWYINFLISQKLRQERMICYYCQRMDLILRTNKPDYILKSNIYDNIFRATILC